MKNTYYNLTRHVSTSGGIGHLAVEDICIPVKVDYIHMSNVDGLSIECHGLSEKELYIKNDLNSTIKPWDALKKEIIKPQPLVPNIEKVIFNGPATIVIWADGTKTVVKCGYDVFDLEKGIAMAIAKKALGNQGNYYNVFKKHIRTFIEERGYD